MYYRTIANHHIHNNTPPEATHYRLIRCHNDCATVNCINCTAKYFKWCEISKQYIEVK